MPYRLQVTGNRLQGKQPHSSAPSCWSAGVGSHFGVRWLATALVVGQLAAPSLPASASCLTETGGQPIIFVRLSRRIYSIRADGPQMPKDVLATATVENWPAALPKPATFAWQVSLDWNGSVYATRHSIYSRTFTHPSPFNIDFGKEIRGGLLTVIACLPRPGGGTLRGKAYAYVLGENPSRKLVLSAFPRTRFGLIASKIGTAESGLHQFTRFDSGKPGGWPLVSRTGDIGLMQLNAPSGAVQSAQEVWDWRANVRRGLLMLVGKRQTTELASRHAVLLERTPEEYLFWVACLNFARAVAGLSPLSPPRLVPLSTQQGTGVQPGEPDPDHLGLSQVEREAIRRYNGGSEYGFGVSIDADTLAFRNAGWQIDPTRGGISPTKGDPNYVLHVLCARSGLTLPPPPAPPSHRQGHRRGHRRHRRHRS